MGSPTPTEEKGLWLRAPGYAAADPLGSGASPRHRADPGNANKVEL